MTLDTAIETVNDRSQAAYCDWVHQRVFRRIGEFEFGFDEHYDQIVWAYAFVAVELALDDDMVEFVPEDETEQ